MSNVASCILSKFYIKPQLPVSPIYTDGRCILSKFYIKPQPCRRQYADIRVVSYRNSTSNHNSRPALYDTLRLYLIEILHQTTTIGQEQADFVELYLIEILHQTTTNYRRHHRDLLLYLIEILHQTTTWQQRIICAWTLYLIEILHQTTTYNAAGRRTYGCILSKFYIKPQRSTRD